VEHQSSLNIRIAPPNAIDKNETYGMNLRILSEMWGQPHRIFDNSTAASGIKMENTTLKYLRVRSVKLSTFTNDL
jgi:hypothetical protein